MSKPWHLLIKPHHLAARFFGSISKRPPDPADEAWAQSQLLDAELDLWRQLNNIDRRHCITVARRFTDEVPGASRAQIAGALLHDIGKVTSQLTTWERVIASMIGPVTPRFREYHDHEEIGARLVAEAGSDPATVDLVAERGPLYPVLQSCDRA